MRLRSKNPLFTWAAEKRCTLVGSESSALRQQMAEGQNDARAHHKTHDEATRWAEESTYPATEPREDRKADSAERNVAADRDEGIPRF